MVLREKMAAMGINTEGLTDKQIRGVAKALNLEIPPEPHKVEIVTYTGKKSHKTARYVKTSSYNVGTTADGKPDNAGGLFLRVEAIDECIADLQKAKELLK